MKIIKVENCISCPISKIDNDELICLQNKHIKKRIGNVYKMMRKKEYIPDWCLLKEYNINKLIKELEKERDNRSPDKYGYVEYDIYKNIIQKLKEVNK